jgi:hypothetical protein
MKNSSITSTFKKPLNISKKKPEVHPGIGEYDQSHYTIEGDLRMKSQRYACSLTHKSSKSIDF